MITFQEEVVCEELYEECKNLFLLHKEELEKSYGDLHIDLLTYIRLYRIGKFKFFSVRESTKVVGYISFILHTLPHYNTLTAEQDLLYISKSYRTGYLGLKLLKYSENALRILGVKRILQRSKIQNDIGSIFKRLGYSPIETVYMKEL